VGNAVINYPITTTTTSTTSTTTTTTAPPYGTFRVYNDTVGTITGKWVIEIKSKNVGSFATQTPSPLVIYTLAPHSYLDLPLKAGHVNPPDIWGPYRITFYGQITSSNKCQLLAGHVVGPVNFFDYYSLGYRAEFNVLQNDNQNGFTFAIY
jgi:hypothetical protein